MSEEKLYAVKNDKGEWLSFDSSHESVWYTNNPTFFNDKSYAEAQAGPCGHVVELVEPEKVVLSKEQAEIVEEAHEATWPAYYITQHAFSSDDEKLLMNAYINGYTVKKEPVSLVYVPGTNKDFVYCKRGKWSKQGANPETPVTPQPIATWRACEDKDESLFEFADEEINKFGLQDCKKEEVTDNAD